MTSIRDAYSYYWINQRLKERVTWETARMVSFYSGFGSVQGLKSYKDVQVFSWDDKGDKGSKNNPWTKEDHDKMRKEGHSFFK